MPKITFEYGVIPKQKLFLHSTKKFSGYVGGIGSGKTWIGCRKTINLLIKNNGIIGVIVAPTYPMLRDATQRTFFEILPHELIKEFNKSENRVMLLNGSEVLFRSADNPETLRGPNLDFFWIDEASLCPEMTWKILIGRIRKGNIDIGFITGTPKGFNWVYNEFVAKKRDDYELLTSSSRENKFLKEDFIKSLQDSYTGVFAKQEIEGEFVGFEGLVYSEFSRNTHVLENISFPFDRVMFFIDWGFTNPMVCLEAGIIKDRIYILKEFYRKQVTIEEFANYLKERKQSYGVLYDCSICDPSEPGFISTLNNIGLRARQANNAVLEGISEVSNRLKNKTLFIHSSCVNTIMEFENYRYADKSENRTEKEMPLKLFDHALDGIRYGCMALKSMHYSPVVAGGGTWKS